MNVVIDRGESSQGAMREDDGGQCGEDGDSDHGGCGDKCLLFHNCDIIRLLINIPSIVLRANVAIKNTAKVMPRWIQQ